MGDLAQAMRVIVEPKRQPHGSFWIDAPREGFTDLCRGLAFPEEQTDRQKRIKASTAAEQQLQSG